MDEKTLGKCYRLWRLVRGLQEEDVPSNIEAAVRAEVARLARRPESENGLGIALTEDDPRFLPKVEKALQEVYKKGAPPSISPELEELIGLHQDQILKDARAYFKAARIPFPSGETKTYQHWWEGTQRWVDEEGQVGEKYARLFDRVDPIEPEIVEKEQIQAQVYQVLKDNDLLDPLGLPDLEVWQNKEAVAPAEEKLVSHLHFDELASKYSFHAYRALEETPALLLYPERHYRLAVSLGREYAQKVNARFYKTFENALADTGDQEAAIKAAQKAAEALTTDLFEKNVGVDLEGIVNLVVFRPLDLAEEEWQIIIEQSRQSLKNYFRQRFHPLLRGGAENLRKQLLPNRPKEVSLDVDPAGRARIRVNPLDQPQNETTYWSHPTLEAHINKTIDSLRGPFGNDAYYMKFQAESFMYDPIKTSLYWLYADPLMAAFEGFVPGLKRAHGFYISYQTRAGELKRWWYLTPQLQYLVTKKLKETLGVQMGLYRKTPIKPVFTPLAWLGKSSSAPFRRGADYFFNRARFARGPWAKKFWRSLGKTFKRREQDWDRNPLSLLVKLVLDVAVGTVGRLIQRFAQSQLGKAWIRFTQTALGQKIFGYKAMRVFRLSVGMASEWARAIISLNTLSGGIGGYLVGAYFGQPLLGTVLGGASGWTYQFYVNITKNPQLLADIRAGPRAARIIGRPALEMAKRPYLRIPFKGAVFGYLVGGWPGAIVGAGLEYLWLTKGWWGRIIFNFLQGKIPGLARLVSLFKKFGFLKHIRFLNAGLFWGGWLGYVLGGIPGAIAGGLAGWGAWNILRMIMGEGFAKTFFARALSFGPAGITGGILGELLAVHLGLPPMGQFVFTLGGQAIFNLLFSKAFAALGSWISTSALPAVSSFLTGTVFGLTVSTIFAIALTTVATGWSIYLLASAFFVEQKIAARLTSPHLPIEKSVIPLDASGQEVGPGEDIFGLYYSLTFRYEPPPETTAMLDNIRVVDRFENLPIYMPLTKLFDIDASSISPPPPGCEYVLSGPLGTPQDLPTAFGWFQNPSAENSQVCPWLGPLSPGESRNITMFLALKDPPLSNFLRGDELLCNTLFVAGDIQGGESLSSSMPAVCIDAQGEIQGFAWPTASHSCCSRDCNFGWRCLGQEGERDWDLHEGIDILENEGRPVMAAASGHVCAQDWSPGYGCYTIVDHDNGLYTLYAHMYDNPTCDLFEKGVGDRVDQGDKVGEVGNTGKVFGAHLHFAIGHSCNLYDYNADDLSRVENPCDYLPGCPSECITEASSCP